MPNTPTDSDRTDTDQSDRIEPGTAARLPSSAPEPVDSPSKTRDLLTAAPTLELPKGGGAIRGIGEKFQTNPVTGSATMSVPIAISPGRNGFGPTLNLSYDSGSGNGPFGMGWSLSAPMIQRRTSKRLPEYRKADIFTMSDAEDLVPISESNVVEGPDTFTVTGYRPRIDAANMRIERWRNQTDNSIHWRTWSPDNVYRTWGTSDESRLFDRDKTYKVFAWYLDLERDEVGNVVKYIYDDETNDGPSNTVVADSNRQSPTFRYLKRILYANEVPDSTTDGFYLEVVFDYGEHTTDTRDPQGPAPQRQDPYSRFKSGFDIRCTRLCRRVLVFHRFPNGVDGDAVLTRITSFDYDENPVASTLTSVTHTGVGPTGDQESLLPVTFTYTQASQASGPELLTGIEDLPNGIDFSRMQWVDLDGEGLTGLLADAGGDWWYKRNDGGGVLAPFRRLPSRPTAALSQAQLIDVDNDSRLELVVNTPGMQGYFARTRDDGWEGFVPFKRNLVGINNSRRIDLDGDGLPDVLVPGRTGLEWYQNEGPDGWSGPNGGPLPRHEDTGPVALYQTDTESVFLADMTGDGLLDVVRVWNGGIDYWPNRGYGSFGGRITMSGSPQFDRRDRFDPKRVRLVDIDGTGPADLIYLGPEAVRWWANQAGNGFGPEQIIRGVPSVESPVQITFADLLGEGTMCAVWASPLGRDRLQPIQFVRLMEEGKPFLMKTVDNGLGRVTTLTYTPSTAYYLADRRAGTPWATKLPFPVQCLSQVDVVDNVTGWSRVSTSTYHHGFYDGVEREFRGFGRVDVADAEQVTHGTNEFDQPPVLTRTWFHTGAWQDRQRLEDAFREEWSDEDPFMPDASTVPSGLAAARTREAWRALKGRPLRVEVYAEDGSADEGKPYTVTTSSYIVRVLEDDSDETYGVFRTDPSETVTTNSERSDTDVRLGHDLVLEVDDFGTVLRSANVAYGHTSATDPAQTTPVVVVSTSEVVNDTADVDRWHVAVPSRSRTYHLVGPTPEPTDLDRATVSTIDAAFLGASDVDWDATGASPYRRLLTDQKISYQDNSGSEVFPTIPWNLGDRVLVHQTYARTFTDSHITSANAFDSQIAGPDLTAAGYVALSGETGWWAPSGTPTRDSANFFVTTEVTDPFGNQTDVGWHATYLFPVSVTDPKSNVTTVTIDLHFLQPASVTDPNDNGSEVAFDPLGRVVAMAVTGAASEGDTLTDPTTAYEYDLVSVPARVRTLQRETHYSVNPTTRFLERWEFSDGNGTVTHTKVKTEPDLATPTTPRWIGTGKIVVDNKGNVIKAYEPFFSANADYEFESDLATSGVASTVKYDPLGRAIQVDLPNGTRRRVEFTPWETSTYDENDTSNESLPDADPALLARGAAHADTPATVHLDAQGRAYKTDELLTVSTTFTTVLTLDVVGNPTVVTDAIDVDTQTQSFDMLGRPIKAVSPDAGETTTLLDVTGQPIQTFRSGSLSTRAVYDALRRMTHLYATEGATERLKERNIYGDHAPDITGVPTSGYFKGRLYRQYDTAGVVTTTGYDFKGNVLGMERRFWDRETGAGRADPDIDWSALTGATVSAIETQAEPDLEVDQSTPVTYTTSQTYDALNRVVTQTTPDASIQTMGYDDGGALQKVDVNVRGAATATPVVRNISYNVRGQRERIDYSEDGSTDAFHTEYEYDPDVFRLTRLRTIRVSDTEVMQDLQYLYDPVGNITSIENFATDTLYFGNMAVTPDQTFVYDALYRLTSASGRERSTYDQPQPGPTFNDPDHNTTMPGPANKIARYSEDYTYDAVGNIREFIHREGGPTGPIAWRRKYRYEGESTATDPPTDPRVSNRLANTTMPGSTTTWLDYVHDARGNIVNMPHLAGDGSTPNILPDFRDQMKRTLINDSGDEVVYLYDSGGQRVRKVAYMGSNMHDRRYLGSAWEVHMKTPGSAPNPSDNIETLHVMDGERRVSMVETSLKGSPTTVHRYQLGNHLGSSVLELTATGAIISYEEYHPYGSTAWWAKDSGTQVSQKRYRYTGMERDEETGLSRHGVRMYAGWLGRWCSADPSGMKDGPNRYAYVRGNPVRFQDLSGNGSEETVTYASDPSAFGAVLAPLSELELLTGVSKTPVLEHFEREGFTPVSSIPTRSEHPALGLTPDDAPIKLTPAGLNIRTIVHESVHALSREGGPLQPIVSQLVQREEFSKFKDPEVAAKEAIAYFVEARVVELLGDPSKSPPKRGLVETLGTRAKLVESARTLAELESQETALERTKAGFAERLTKLRSGETELGEEIGSIEKPFDVTGIPELLQAAELVLPGSTNFEGLRPVQRIRQQIAEKRLELRQDELDALGLPRP